MALDTFGNQKQIDKSNDAARNTFYWPDNLKGQNLVWRLPRNTAWNDNVIVREDEMAVFFRDGKALHVFDRPDRYALTTQNVPVLATLGAALTGVRQIGEVYYVQKREFRGKFESANTMTFRDKDFGLANFIVSGQFAYKVSNPMLFITQFIGTKGMQHTDEIAHWLQDQILMTINAILGNLQKNKGMGILDMPAYLSEIEQMCLSNLTSETEQYGLKITKFSGLVIKMSEAVQKAIDQRSAMSALGVNYMQLQTGQAIGGIGVGAEKGGDAAGIAGLGAGIGAGMAMSQAMGQAMISQPAPHMAGSPQISAGFSLCPKCGFKANGSVKYCPECGNQMTSASGEEMRCPFCKAVIKANVKFCPECGKKVTFECPKCNTKIEPNEKFCHNCGARVVEQ
ncbi:SPFH domain-containing protein [Methanoregula sp. UBA64]|jgi:membrane protease subunit (stomatin/prohibitin family)|uniref:SPFH domain-containing protein n=1 Tax=Methanoregula sp. UBA64 TaxID=1915554 RepID=UPI002600351F|nr:SPFH domain-containing protein [Methanoregula sp. UBA64]